jgi:hypothetical protein
MCPPEHGWLAECPFAKSKVYFVLLPCVAFCDSCVIRCWLSNAASHGAWRGSRPRPQFDDCCRHERICLVLRSYSLGRVLHTSLSRVRHAHGGGFAGSEV